MQRVLPWLVALILASCSGESASRNDTGSTSGMPPEDGAITAARPMWDARAGQVFAVRSGPGGAAWLVNPSFDRRQALDTLTRETWDVGEPALELIGPGQVLGTGTATGIQFDSTCAGWPVATLMPAPPQWLVAFPPGRIEGLAFDSLPGLAPADSAARVRLGALTASRLPDDTLAAFRGRPFIVRQALRFTQAPDSITLVFEVVRLVPQEANPLEERLVILAEGAVRDSALRAVYHERETGPEESIASFEVAAVLRVRASGALALLVRRDREAGFILEWIQRGRGGRWSVRWQAAADGC